MAQVKNPSADAGNTRDLGSIPGLRRSPGEGKGNPLQYSCLENPTDRGAWRAIVHGASKSQTWLSNWTHTHIYIYTYLSIYLFIFNLKSLLANPSSLVNHFVMLNEISSRDSVDISARAKKKKKKGNVCHQQMGTFKRCFFLGCSDFCLALCECLYFNNVFSLFLKWEVWEQASCNVLLEILKCK